MGARERLARLRRAAAGGEPPGGRLELGPLAVDAAAGEVRWNGTLVPLTARERSVLHTLARGCHRLVTPGRSQDG